MEGRDLHVLVFPFPSRRMMGSLKPLFCLSADSLENNSHLFTQYKKEKAKAAGIFRQRATFPSPYIQRMHLHLVELMCLSIYKISMEKFIFFFLPKHDEPWNKSLAMEEAITSIISWILAQIVKYLLTYKKKLPQYL